jgi:hypothetical protein
LAAGKPVRRPAIQAYPYCLVCPWMAGSSQWCIGGGQALAVIVVTS